MADRRQTLGENVIPLNYVLAFEPDLKSFKYKCRETISVIIKKGTKSIRLNAIGITIKNAIIIKGKKSQSANIKLDKELEQAILNFKSPVSNSAELNIEFEGHNQDKLSGFYRSKYNTGSKENYILTTQFEPADARKAFPCFDEPSLKATFELSFLIDKDLTAISNMPEKRSKTMGRKKLVSFQRSPKMSPYLLYFGIGKFEILKGKYGKIGLNVVTVPGRIKLAETALDYGKKFLKYYEDYFGIKYPLPKMDFIAIPDFPVSGMENWGAITYSEIALLTDKKATSVMAKQRIAGVVAHELAHQWFGDLVTMRWWDNLWLNESFATFMSYKAMQAVYPDWEIEVQATLSRTGMALGADQLRSTQPVAVQVNTPGDMSEAFDPAITYSKGGAILVMLEDYVGEAVFRRGLRTYMKRYSYSNATEHDLWREIGKATGGEKASAEFDAIATYWINKPGYPIVELKESENKIELEQRRFFLLDKEDHSTWPIPIHFIQKDGKNKKDGLVLLNKKRTEIKEKNLDYIKLNHMQKGFYRVKYPERILDRLGGLIKSKELQPLDGWGIENDLYSIARSKGIKVWTYLDFVEKYCFDSEFPLNSSISGHLNGLYFLLEDNERLVNRIRDISLRYHNHILDRLGWQKDDKESNTTTLLRNSAISSLGILEDRVVVERAKELFKDYLKNGRPIESNIRGVIYAINARFGDSTTFEKFIELYKKEEIPEDKIRFLRAIGSVKDPVLIDRALKFTLTKNVRLQYVDWIPSLLATEVYGRGVIWSWVRGNWKKLMSMYERGPGGLDGFVDLLSVIYDKKTRDEIESFFKKKENYRDDIKRSIAKTLEFIDINIYFREFNRT